MRFRRHGVRGEGGCSSGRYHLQSSLTAAANGMRSTGGEALRRCRTSRRSRAVGKVVGRVLSSQAGRRRFPRRSRSAVRSASGFESQSKPV